MLRASARVWELTAARTTSPASSPAASAARRSRHSQVASRPEVVSPVLLRQGVGDELVVAPPVGRACQVGPPRVQHAQVVGVGQGPVPVVAGGQFGVFTVQAVGQHRHRIPHLILRLLGGLGWQARPFPVHPLPPGQFRVGPGAGLGVGFLRLDRHRGAAGVLDPFVGDGDRGVVLDAAGHRDIQPLPRFAAGDQRRAAADGAAHALVPGHRVPEIGDGA